MYTEIIDKKVINQAEAAYRRAWQNWVALGAGPDTRFMEAAADALLRAELDWLTCWRQATQGAGPGKEKAMLLRRQKLQWVKSRCSICGKEYEHLENYTPKTCGKFSCIQEAVKQGILPCSEPYSGISYS